MMDLYVILGVCLFAMVFSIGISVGMKVKDKEHKNALAWGTGLCREGKHSWHTNVYAKNDHETAVVRCTFCNIEGQASGLLQTREDLIEKAKLNAKVQ
jgi:hypothetical protein